jgi:hypothetical protein
MKVSGFPREPVTLPRLVGDEHGGRVLLRAVEHTAQAVNSLHFLIIVDFSTD